MAATPASTTGAPSPAAGAGAVSIVLAGLGTFIALAAVGALASTTRMPWVLGSFGASCVLLFGFPQGPFSQPRNIIGGHLLTSVVGLVFLKACGPGWVAMAAAAACATSLMLWTRTTHPPAGSNPIIIFMGHDAGWSFLAMPVAFGALVIVGVGWVYWRVRGGPRRWPLSWWK